MTFDHPGLLWFLLLAPLDLGFALLRARRWRASLSALSSRAFRGPGEAPRRGLAAVAAASSALFVAASVVALAGPSWGTRAVLVERSGLEVAIVLDVSRSMGALDASGGGRPGTSRLEAARALVRLVLGGAGGDAFSLVVAKGGGSLLVPMTEDLDSVDSGLDWADPGAMSMAGTDLGAGIEAGLASFSPLEGTGKLLLLLSDGGDLRGRAREAAAEARAGGVGILAVGFGGLEPAEIPGPDARPLLEASGEAVKTARDPVLLRALAQISGGRYFDSEDGAAVSGIVAEMTREGRGGVRLVQKVRHQASLFAGLALAALALRLGLGLAATAGLGRRPGSGSGPAAGTGAERGKE